MSTHNETQTPYRRDGLLTPQQAADYLALPVETLRHWRNARTGPDFVRVGKHVRYTAAALDAWVAAQTVHRGGAA